MSVCVCVCVDYDLIKATEKNKRHLCFTFQTNQHCLLNSINTAENSFLQVPVIVNTIPCGYIHHTDNWTVRITYLYANHLVLLECG